MATQVISTDGTIEWNGIEFFDFVGSKTVKAMNKAAILTQGIAKKMVGGVGRGLIYKKSANKKFIRTATTTGKLDRRFKQNRGRYHRASAPGDPPARDTGILANSISFTVKRRFLGIVGEVGSDLAKIRSKDPTSDPEYGLTMEFGTRDGRIAARPWLRPSLIKATPKIDKIFKKAMEAIK